MGRLLPTLEPAEAAELEACLSDPSIDAASLSAALQKRGYGISQQMVQRHRKRMCCGQSR